jgi:hypothetical protein
MSKLKLVNRGTHARFWLAGLLGAGTVAVTGVSNATPGAHPPLFSTSDTRASSVVLAYRQALGPLTARMISYNANFSSTGGILSAQFGAHVLQLQETSGANTLYGAGATGTALWSVPLSSRYDNGVASVALMVYAGGAPVAAVSGERNFLNVPIGVGLGVPLSPKSWVTFTPWFEAAPGLDLDTTIRPPDLSQFEPDENDIQNVLNGQDAVLVSEDDVRNAISESVVVDVSFEAAMRAGLDITLRASDSWSFNINSYVTTLGSAFGGQSYVYLGAGLLFHWDDVVPSVLPAATRLQRESCDDVEARFRMCPPKQVQSVCEAPNAPVSSTSGLAHPAPPPDPATAPKTQGSDPVAPAPLPAQPTPPPSPTTPVTGTGAPTTTPPAVSFPQPPTAVNSTPALAPAPVADAATNAPPAQTATSAHASAVAPVKPVAPPATVSPSPAPGAPAPNTPATAGAAKPAPVPVQPPASAAPAPTGHLPNTTSPY